MKKLIDESRALLSDVSPLVSAMLILSVVGMNLLANKSIDTGLEWLALDCGILLSWMTFLAMDVLTQCYGPKTATLMSVIAIGFNLLMAAIFWIAGALPGVWSESFVEGSENIINTALNNTFGGTWFIILGSSVAFFCSSVVNNFLNYNIGIALDKKDSFGNFAVRAYLSTFIGQFTDNMVFALLVSKVFFGWSLIQCTTCAFTGAVMELLFEIFFSPVGYRIAKQIRKER